MLQLAWTFNLGSIYGGAKKTLARFALHSIDRFIVHSWCEIDTYAAGHELALILDELEDD
jgi:hypothetical protein